MSYPGSDIDFPSRSLAEQRLFDFFAVYNCAGAPDSYLEESLALLRSIKSHHAEVIDKLTLYLQHVKSELLRCQISQEIERRESLLKQESKQKDRKGK